MHRSLDATVAALQSLSIYANDQQIQQVAYQWTESECSSYTVTVRTIT